MFITRKLGAAFKARIEAEKNYREVSQQKRVKPFYWFQYWKKKNKEIVTKTTSHFSNQWIIAYMENNEKYLHNLIKLSSNLSRVGWK